MSQKAIETDRLVIRSLIPDDLSGIHCILNQTLGDGSKVDGQTALRERRSWLQRSIPNQEWLPQLHQPPSRAISHSSSLSNTPDSFLPISTNPISIS